MRVVVVCGAGAPSRPTADATAAAARADGAHVVHVVVADADPVDEPGGPWLDVLSASLASLGSSVTPADLLAGPGESRRAAALERVRAAAADPSIDLVVVDAGDVAGARDLLAHAPAVERIAASVLGPALAMESRDDETGTFDRLTRARDDAARLDGLLCGGATTWRLAVPPREAEVPASLRALAALVVLGARVDGVVVDAYPRKRESPPARRDAADALAALSAAAGVAVWRGGPGRRAVPAGAPASGPAGPVATLVPHEPLGDDDAWEWGIGLPPAVVPHVRVGVAEDRLVLEAAGAYRWLDLPPVLRRTVAVDAARQPGGLLVRFRPDPDAWRSPAPAEPEDS